MEVEPSPKIPRVRPPKIRPQGWEMAFLAVASAGLPCLLGDIHEDPSGSIIIFWTSAKKKRWEAHPSIHKYPKYLGTQQKLEWKLQIWPA